MDFINDANKWFSDTITPMSRGAQVTTVALLVAIGVGLVCLFRGASSSADEYLLGGRAFSSAEIAKIELAFSAKDLNGWEEDGNRIKVPRGMRHRYLAAIADANAEPTDPDSFWKTAFSGNMWESSIDKRMRVAFTRKRELEMTISEMTGIKNARVSIGTREQRGLAQGEFRTASVSISAENNRAIPPHIVNAVRGMAASALAVERADITIVDLGVGREHKGSDQEDGGVNGYIAAQESYVEHYRLKIADQLSYIPGAVVNVNVAIKSIAREETYTHSTSPPVAYKTSSFTEESQGGGSRAQGVPGLASNGGSSANSSASVSPTPQNTKSVTRENQEFVVGHETTIKTGTPYEPQYVSVAIGIPEKYIQDLWKTRNPVAEGEEAKAPTATEMSAIKDQTETEIEAMVAKLLPPVTAGADPFPRIAVKFTPGAMFTPILPPSMAENAGAWLAENYQTLLMAVFGLVGLIMMRGMVKAAQDNTPSAPGAAGMELSSPGDAKVSPADEENDDETEDSLLKARFRENSGPNLRDELADMVREDPDAAATVLSSWIGDAA
jgi:flagellar M-ring protein FliF